MSGSEEPVDTLALRCASGGEVREVLRDGAATGLRPGRTVTEMLAADSVRTVLRLLRAAAEGRAERAPHVGVVDAEGRARSLLMLGCPTDPDEQVVLVGAATPEALHMLVEGLVDDPAGTIGTLAIGTLRGLVAQVQREARDEATLTALSEAHNELAGMHRELARSNAQLELLNERKDRILGMVAHDLRNPLGSIGGFADTLERHLDDALDDRSRLMLTRIKGLSRRMLLLVEDLLDASVIASGQFSLDLEEIDLTVLLAETVDTYRFAAARKGVELDLADQRRPVHVWADSNRLVQVFDNLLSNAIKFSPDHAGAVVTITCQPADGSATVTVTDTGIGIPAEDRGRLFQPPAGTSRPGTSEEPGTGLGLAISRSIVEAHGGSIEVDSEVGRGSTFTVRLPVRPPDHATHAGAPAV